MIKDLKPRYKPVAFRYNIMQVFNPDQTEHELKVIPRTYPIAAGLTIRHESTGQVTQIDINCTTVSGYLTATFTYTFTEGGSYEITIKSKTDGSLLFRGKAYATSKSDLENYKLTNEA